MAKNQSFGEAIGTEIDQAVGRLGSEKQRLEERRQKLQEQITAQQAELSQTETSLIHITREIQKAVRAVMQKYGMQVDPTAAAAPVRGGRGRQREEAAVTDETKAKALAAMRKKGGSAVTARTVTTALGAAAQPVLDALLAEGKIVEGESKGNKRSYSLAS